MEDIISSYIQREERDGDGDVMMATEAADGRYLNP